VGGTNWSAGNWIKFDLGILDVVQITHPDSAYFKKVKDFNFNEIQNSPRKYYLLVKSKGIQILDSSDSKLLSKRKCVT
jgi:hypothetical protein